MCGIYILKIQKLVGFETISDFFKYYQLIGNTSVYVNFSIDLRNIYFIIFNISSIIFVYELTRNLIHKSM